MANRFFPNGGNGTSDDPRNEEFNQTNPQPGDTKVFFDKGILEVMQKNGITHIIITEKGLDLIKRVNK